MCHYVLKSLAVWPRALYGCGSYMGLVVWPYMGLVVWPYMGLVAWSYMGLVVWSYMDLVVWFYMSLVVWSYMGLVLWPYMGLVVWFYMGLVLWSYMGLVLWPYMGLVLWPYMGLVVWFDMGLVVLPRPYMGVPHGLLKVLESASAPLIAEVHSADAVRFLDPTLWWPSDESLKLSYVQAPSYASGHVFATSMLHPLVGYSYFMPLLMPLLQNFVDVQDAADYLLPTLYSLTSARLPTAYYLLPTIYCLLATHY